jgi:two-component system, NtrC family, sensor kinase
MEQRSRGSHARSEDRLTPTAQQLEEELRLAHAQVLAAEARIAELEAQNAAYRRAQGANTSSRLSTLLVICAALLVTRDVDQILDMVVRESIDLFPGASGVLLYLMDAEGKELQLSATSAGLFAKLALQPGQGVAGRAYLAPRAMLMAGPELDVALAELTPEQEATVAQVIQPWPPNSALLAPLRIEAQRIGSLVLYGSTHAHLFHPRDLPFVQALADLAAVAITENRQRTRAVHLQNALTQTQSLHAEAQARLNAAQAQLLQSAKLAAVGELAASVAHEINNPLYAARNSLYLVEQELPPDSQHHPFLQIAQTELGRIAKIITRMRDFYRPARDELEPTEINDLLAETIELVQTHLRHGQVMVSNDLTPGLPLLTAHADQLRQVFLNLMLNACDAMPNGGTLHIATSLASSPEGVETIVVQVRDTGVGIADEHLEHLFEPFYTTKAQGTGLGLAISMHIATQHGGNITVTSQVGEGTTFTVTLPIEHPSSR